MTDKQKETLILELRAAAQSLSDDQLFADLISKAGKELEDEEISTLFSVARSTVNRWKSGVATPHPIIKQRVYQVLSDYLENKHVS